MISFEHQNSFQSYKDNTFNCLLPTNSIFAFLFSFAAWYHLSAQTAIDTTIFAVDTNLLINNNDSLSLSDTTTKTDSLSSFKIAKDSLEAPVLYYAEDSIDFNLIEQKVYLYGKAHVEYTTISLDADYIVFDWGKHLITAIGLPDSTGEIIGEPVLVDDGKTYNAKKIIYNYETKKGKIYHVITEEAGGYVHGEEIKKNEKDELFIRHAQYTTCSLPEPHYGMKISKLKVIPDKQIVAGPSVMVFEDVPTPLFIPLGIFPIQKKQASGLIFPQYGESTGQGFYLRNGGYYFGISDYIDLSITGDIYSRGSWGFAPKMNYAKRYRFNGNIGFNYAVNKVGIPESPQYSETKNFRINWTHNQDTKAKPTTNFRTSVNIVTSGFYQNNSYNPDDFLTNDIKSTIHYDKTFRGTPFMLNMDASHSQNLKTHQVTTTLPELTLNMNRIYPFKRKVIVGQKGWYEDIGLNYVMNTKNTISTYDTLLFDNPDIFKDFNNGMKQSATLNIGSYRVLKYLNLSILPSFSYNEYWYLKTVKKEFNVDSNKVIITNVNGFQTARDFSDPSMSLNTNIFGMYNFKKGRLKAIRHQMTPSIGARYKIDFSEDFWGYYETIQSDTLGNTLKYSKFENGIVGGPGAGTFGGIDFSIKNNIGMKVASKKDTTEELKKVSLLDQLSLSSNYNLLADSLNLAPFSLSANTRLFNKINTNLTSSYDPYISNDQNIRLNQFEWDVNKRPVRMTRTSLNLSTDFKSKTKKSDKEQKEKESLMYLYPGDYVDFDIPWSVSIRYNLTLDKKYVNQVDTTLITQSLSFSAEVSLTPKWKINVQSGYDFVSKKMTSNTKFTIYRDLHCWELSFDIIPFGQWQSYNLVIKPKSSILQDLRLVRKRDWFDN